MSRNLKLKLHDIIAVDWLDQSYHNGPDELRDKPLHPIHGTDVGHFLEENKDWICMSMQKFDAPAQKHQDTVYRHIVTIPKCAIARIEILKKSKR